MRLPEGVAISEGVSLEDIQLWSAAGGSAVSCARRSATAPAPGMRHRSQVGRVLECHIPRFPGVAWPLQTHHTPAMAIPNVLAAMQHRVTSFDGSIGGLG